MTTPSSSHPGTPFGIDLGTTMSVVARLNSVGEPVVLPNSEGSPTTPSVVLFDGQRAVVGQSAKDAIATEPDMVVQLVKRHMGSDWTYDVNRVQFHAEHVSAIILRKLMQDVRNLPGTSNRAVVTVPAYFNEAMRLATKRAGMLAGIDVIALLSEPTAAAIAFGFDNRPEQSIGIVVDLGGGTFDVTVMRYEGAELTVLSTGGDSYLGGANFDKALFDRFAREFETATGLDVNDPDALDLEEFAEISGDWLTRATRAKHDLSTRDRTVVALQAGGLQHRLTITTEEFEQDCSVLLDEMEDAIGQVVTDAGLTIGDVDLVLGVGGSTRMPMVRDRVRRLLGKDLDLRVRPDETVALGAALYAAQRGVEAGEDVGVDEATLAYLERMKITDVGSRSLGINVLREVGGGSSYAFQPILRRNTALPCEGIQVVYTARPNETEIVIPILEGDEADGSSGERIGQIAISGLPTGRPASQPVEVRMRYDLDGILEVEARDLTSQRLAQTKIERGGAEEVNEHDADAVARSIHIP